MIKGIGDRRGFLRIILNFTIINHFYQLKLIHNNYYRSTQIFVLIFVKK